MRALLASLVLLLFVACSSTPNPTPATTAADPAQNPDYVHHPKPTEPTMLDPVAYDQIREKIAAPPIANSTAQKSDEKELLRIQKSRTAQECDRARNAVKVNLKTFFGIPDGTLNEKDVETLSPFFNSVRNDADYVIQKLKVEFPRPRPYEYIAGLEPCVLKEVSKAYPSGHTALSRLYALILTDLYPKDKKKFQERALTIGNDRVLSGMHHPTDVSSGRTLGDLLYAEFKKNEKFKTALAEAKKQIVK